MTALLVLCLAGFVGYRYVQAKRQKARPRTVVWVYRESRHRPYR